MTSIPAMGICIPFGGDLRPLRGVGRNAAGQFAMFPLGVARRFIRSSRGFSSSSPCETRQMRHGCAAFWLRAGVRGHFGCACSRTPSVSPWGSCLFSHAGWSPETSSCQKPPVDHIRTWCGSAIMPFRARTTRASAKGRILPVLALARFIRTWRGSFHCLRSRR